MRPTERVPGWLDELDLRTGDGVRLGTRNLDPDRWSRTGPDAADQVVEARRLLDERTDDVVVVDPASAHDEALVDAARWLGERLARWWTARDPAAVAATRWGPPLDAGPVARGLARARHAVPDDLCLLVPSQGGGWRLAAAAVCFPSHWVPAAAVGGPLGEVHGPVPGYAGVAAERVDTLLRRLRPGRGVWRRNWSIHADAALHAPHPTAPPSPVPPEERWLRSEHQTLVRAETGRVVGFTIRTQQVPLVVLAERPDVAEGLAAAVRAWSPEVRSYKGGAVDDELLGWLDAVGAGDPQP